MESEEEHMGRQMEAIIPSQDRENIIHKDSLSGKKKKS